MSSEPDLIIWGAHFRTLDDRQPFCTAVAVKDGVIVSTGDDDAVRALRGAGTQVIDGRGIAFVPGLTDSHLHPISSSIATRGVDLFDAVTLEVEDDGPGLPDVAEDALFRRGFSTKGARRGRGLGIVRDRVEEANGTIRFERRERGTRVCVVLPRGGAR